MATHKFDVLIIGAGHNGLVHAAYLARAGKKVLVVEKRHLVGGATVTEEVYPGFKFSVFSYVVSLLRPQIIEDLNLPEHGLCFLPLDGTFTPLPEGNCLARWHDSAKTRRELQRFSRKDADAYPKFGMHMHHMSRAVRGLIEMHPPEPTSLKPSDLAGMARLGLHFQGLGEQHLYDVVRLMTMSSADYLDEWFETDPLKATMSASGIIGTFLGPRSPGTAYVMLHHYMGEIDGVSRSWGFPEVAREPWRKPSRPRPGALVPRFDWRRPSPRLWSRTAVFEESSWRAASKSRPTSFRLASIPNAPT